MREIHLHEVEGDLPQNQVKIMVADKPGAGGVNHKYIITGFYSGGNPSETLARKMTTIIFQNGPIKETGVNGITQEALLAIVIDRLQGFQDGPFPCEENRVALSHCLNALYTLKLRTENRLKRGVEGETKA